MIDGYAVRWCDGAKENWPYESLVPCLVKKPVKELVIDDVVGSGEDTGVNVGVDDGRDVIDVERIEFEGKYLDDSGEEDGIIDPSDCS